MRALLWIVIYFSSIFTSSTISAVETPKYIKNSNIQMSYFEKDGWQQSLYYGVGRAAGDVNGDGFDDVLVFSAAPESENPKIVWLFYGSDSGLAPRPVWEYTSVEATSAGDVNNDGFDDILVYTGEQGFEVFHGNSAGLSSLSSWIYRIPPGESRNLVGGAKHHGDVNGDGFSDIVFVHRDSNSLSKAVLFIGTNNGLQRSPFWEVTTTSFGTHHHYGKISLVGDLNNDGFEDVVLENQLDNDSQGSIFVFYGNNVRIHDEPDVVIHGLDAKSRFGANFSGGGDITGDGYDDLLVSAYGPEDGTGFARRFVFSGGPDGLTTVPWLSVEEPWGVGWITGVSDVNDDQCTDYAVGNPWLSEIDVWAGCNQTSQIPLWSMQTGAHFGWPIDVADINGDTRIDLIVGAHISGQAHVFFGDQQQRLVDEHQTPFADEKRTPLIIVPGIMGSYLDHKDDKSCNLWPFNQHRYGSSNCNGKWTRLDFSNEIIATDVLRSGGPFLYYSNETEYNKLISTLTTEYNYRFTDSGLTSLERCYKSDQNDTLFTFAYDWRQSNVINAIDTNIHRIDSLKELIDCVRSKTGASSVDIIAHSMGGLLVRRYMLEYPEETHVRKFISVATPWLGTPKALTTRFSGEALGWVPTIWLKYDAKNFRSMMSNYQSLAQIMPNSTYFDIADDRIDPVVIANDMTNSSSIKRFIPSDYLSILAEYNSKVTFLDFSRYQSELFGNPHVSDWRNDPVKNVQYYHFYGSGRQTPIQVELKLNQSCSPWYALWKPVMQCDLFTIKTTEDDLGDGSVTAISASRITENNDLNATNAKIWINNLEHLPMVGNKRLIKCFGQILVDDKHDLCTFNDAEWQEEVVRTPVFSPPAVKPPSEWHHLLWLWVQELTAPLHRWWLWVHELIAGWVIMASRPIADFADYIGRLPALVELLPLWVAEQIGLVQAWTSEQFGLLQAWVLEQQWLPGWMLWMLEWPIELLKGIVWWLFELLRWLLPWLAELIVPLVRAALESMVQPLQDWLTSIEAWMVSLAN